MSFPAKISIEPYSEDWPAGFAELRSVYELLLGNRIMAVHHVGSTSVPGLPAKPIIDIDLVIGHRDFFQPVKELLLQAGYNHAGDMGIENREAFRMASETVPRFGTERNWPRHNLYVCPKDNIALRNHLCFRDYLRANPDKVREYAEIKQRLAQLHSYDMESYVEGKSAFITEALRQCGFDEETLKNISQQNKAKK